MRERGRAHEYHPFDYMILQKCEEAYSEVFALPTQIYARDMLLRGSSERGKSMGSDRVYNVSGLNMNLPNIHEYNFEINAFCNPNRILLMDHNFHMSSAASYNTI
jgi:hypothetical protein